MSQLRGRLQTYTSVGLASFHVSSTASSSPSRAAAEAEKLKALALELSPAARHKEEEEEETNRLGAAPNWGLWFSKEEEAKAREGVALAANAMFPLKE